MPSDDYTPIVRGGLKLKGASSSGIKKKKKKDKSKTSASASNEEALSKAVDESVSATNKDGKVKGKGKGEGEEGLEGEEDLDLTTLEQRDQHDGKTASERAYEENRRKRVCPHHFLYLVPLFPPHL